MGYDMQMVSPPARRVPGYTPQTRGQPGLFLFSNRAMDVMLDVMTAAGVLDDEMQRELPPWPPKGISPRRIDALGAEHFLDGADSYVVFTYPNAPTAREAPLFDRWGQDTSRQLAGRSTAPDKVPACKFQSQAGWFVAPEECRLISDALQRGLEHETAALLAPLLSSGWTPAKAEKWLRSWATFNRVAADHGGYRVL